MLARGTGWRLAKLTGLGIAVAAVLSGCSVGETFRGFGWFEGISPEGRRFYELWIGSCIAAFMVGFFVWGLIFWCVIRYRKRGEDLPAQTRFNMPMEFLYTIVPFLIISVLFYYTAITQNEFDRKAPNPDVTIEVTAYKWNWMFRHVSVRGADGQAPELRGPAGEPITTIGSSDYIPVLVVPSGRRIHFIERSEDVVHSFWVPELLFKRDVFPGSIVNTFQVSDLREGAYVGRCAELCGAYHSMMNFEMRVVSQADFDEYLRLRQEGRSTPDALAQATGQSGFATTTTPFEREPEQREDRRQTQ